MIATEPSAQVEPPRGEAPALQWWDHQRRWLEDRSRLRVCCKARQIGLSTVLAAEALHAAVYGETTIIVSASQRQASELLRKAAHLIPLVTTAADGAVHVDKQSAEAIELSTGGRVISLPASAATVQGYTGHVVIDEASWIPEAEELWMAVVPTISTRSDYRLSVVSTPGPRAGMFHRLWNNGDAARAALGKDTPESSALLEHPTGIRQGRLNCHGPETDQLEFIWWTCVLFRVRILLELGLGSS